MRLHIITTIAALTLIFSVTAQDGQKIDQLAERMISALQKFDTTNYGQYRSMFISLKEVHGAVDEMNVPDEEKAEMHERMTADFIEEYTMREFDRLCAETQLSGIQWNKIVYEDFLYEVRRKRGLKEVRGDLYFQQGDKHYEIRVLAVLTGGEFKPVEVERFRESFELHGYPEGYESEAEMEAEELLRQMEEALEEAMAEEAAEEMDYESEEEMVNRMREMEELANEADNEEFEPIYAPDDAALEVSEKEPEFPGGSKALQGWIAKNIQYPEEAIMADISGSVFIRFVVEKDGYLSNFEILRSPHDSLSEEAVRLVRSMPRWVPGEEGGRPARVWYTLPLHFELE